MKKDIFLLVLIALFGLYLRMNNINWDSSLHLHPDERFLTMVGVGMLLPKNIIDYLTPAVSTFNPANINFPFFVYGLFPLVLNKLVAIVLKNDTYDLFALQGRVLAAFFDTVSIFMVYKLVELWEVKKNDYRRIKLWAAFFYSTLVLPIQHAHFFVVDTFLVSLSLFSLYFILRFLKYDKTRHLVLSAVCFGLAVASKINALFFAPLFTYALIRYFQTKKTSIKKFMVIGFLFLSISYIVVRLASPYYFQEANFFNPRPSVLFINNLKSLKSGEGADTWMPPEIQWISKQKVTFTFANLTFYGFGIVQTFFISIGLLSVLRKRNNLDLLVIILWSLVITAYQSVQFVQSLRYLIFLYPYAGILGGIGIYVCIQRLSNPFLKNVRSIGIFVIVVSLLIWPLAFSSIYFHPHSRLVASEWVYKNVPAGATILTEYWDDALPVSYGNNFAQTYQTVQLKVFDPDTQSKWDIMGEELRTGDYYILSSNRGWGSIMTVPNKYPRMSKFYSDLLDGKTSYKKVAEFTSYPSLRYLGIPIDFPDDASEEVFTVYDHPKVIIFKNYGKQPSQVPKKVL